MKDKLDPDDPAEPHGIRPDSAADQDVAVEVRSETRTRPTETLEPDEPEPAYEEALPTDEHRDEELVLPDPEPPSDTSRKPLAPQEASIEKPEPDAPATFGASEHLAEPEPKREPDSADEPEPHSADAHPDGLSENDLSAQAEEPVEHTAQTFEAQLSPEQERVEPDVAQPDDVTECDVITAPPLERALLARIPEVAPSEAQHLRSPAQSVPIFDTRAAPSDALLQTGERAEPAQHDHRPEPKIEDLRPPAIAPAGPLLEARTFEAERPHPAEPFEWHHEATTAAASAVVATPAEVRPYTEGRTAGSYIRQALRLATLTAVGLVALVCLLIVLYRWINPPASTLMLGQGLTGTKITQRWVPIDRISPYLQRAVITSEDGNFCRHHGVDWGELREAIESARDGVPRGGSTISMQLVKNLFLWPSKSYVRKAMEIPLTYAIETVWTKRRILEIYLNVAEWGPGVFGAEAAARYHFGKPAAQLTPGQAALLAVSLPNPFERRAGAPGPGTQRLAATVQARMLAHPGNAACVLSRQ